MKRIVLALAAFSILAAPMAAQAEAGNQVEYRHNHKQPDRKQQFHKPDPRHSQWSKGKRLPGWQRKHVMRDYHRYGLQRPGRGQQWVRVDNSYILINVASGIIAGIIASR